MPPPFNDQPNLDLGQIGLTTRVRSWEHSRQGMGMMMRGKRRAPRKNGPTARAAPDVGTHVPYLIGSISNNLATTSSIVYRALFDIGLTEWRLMWVLALDPDVTARFASQKVGLDKAAASRAIAGLTRRGLLRISDNPEDSRERVLRLSLKGERLYRRMIVVAKERERMLLAGFSKPEIIVLADMLQRLHPQAVKIRGLPPSAFKSLVGKSKGRNPGKGL